MTADKIKEIEQKYDMWADDFNLDPQDVEWLIEQAERVHELEDELIVQKEYFEELQNNHIRVCNQNKRYREALEFYADKENYKPFDGIFLSSYQNKVDEDGGEIARKALKGE